MENRIFVIDDEMDFLQSVRRGLITSGFNSIQLEKDPRRAASLFKDGELFDPSIKPSGIIGSVGSINDDMLLQSKMECSSCHDVHNAASTGSNLLIKDNAGSALCLTCHNK